MSKPPSERPPANAGEPTVALRALGRVPTEPLKGRLDRDFLNAYGPADRERLHSLVGRALRASGGDIEIAARALSIPRGAITLILEEDPELMQRETEPAPRSKR